MDEVKNTVAAAYCLEIVTLESLLCSVNPAPAAKVTTPLPMFATSTRVPVAKVEAGTVMVWVPLT